MTSKRAQRKLTKKDIGDNLERLVEKLFRKKGYKTEKNIYLEGKSRTKHEIDVYAVIKGPLHEDKILIECKAHSEPIGKDAVMKLKHIVEDVGANVGIVISESGFTSGAIQFANEVNIDLMDGHELEKELKSVDIDDDKVIKGESFSEHLITEYPRLKFIPEFTSGMNPSSNVYLGLYGYEVRNLLNETIEDARLYATLYDDKKNRLKTAIFFLPTINALGSESWWFAHEDEKQNPNFIKVKLHPVQKIGMLYPNSQVSQLLPEYSGLVASAREGNQRPRFIFYMPHSVYEDYRDKLHVKMVLKSGRRTIEERFFKPQIDDETVNVFRKKAMEALQKADDKSGCFIATAVYGTPYAKELIILRNFRDESLSKNFFGRLFITAYYKVSPPIANVISKSIFLRKTVGYVLVYPLIKTIKHLRTNP